MALGWIGGRWDRERSRQSSAGCRVELKKCLWTHGRWLVFPSTMPPRKPWLAGLFVWNRFSINPLTYNGVRTRMATFSSCSSDPFDSSPSSRDPQSAQLTPGRLSPTVFFSVKVKGHHRVFNEKLDIVGRLLGCTRLLDMVLNDEKAVDAMVAAFLEGNYGALAAADSNVEAIPKSFVRVRAEWGRRVFFVPFNFTRTSLCPFAVSCSKGPRIHGCSNVPSSNRRLSCFCAWPLLPPQ